MHPISAGAVEIAALPGKTIFEQNRFAVLRPPHEAQAPLILALECGQGVDVERWDREVPEALWRRAAERRMHVVLDASSEGALHDRATTKILLQFLKAKGVRGPQVVYLTQERGWEADYNAAFDLPADRRIRVLNADYFIRRYFRGLESAGPALFQARHARFLARAAHRPHRFISLNYTPRESKVVFLLRLMRDGAWDQGVISFGGFDRGEGVKPMRVREWGEELQALSAYQDRLAALGRTVIGDDTPGRTPVDDGDLPQHDETWFSVVTESEMRERPSRITEKPCKPLVNFHPLIFLGNPGSLPLLRDLGFETFDGFFDESYDHEADPKRRFAMVYDQVLALSRADETELSRRSDEVAERLVHNARWGLTELPRRFRKRLDYALLNTILN